MSLIRSIISIRSLLTAFSLCLVTISLWTYSTIPTLFTSYRSIGQGELVDLKVILTNIPINQEGLAWTEGDEKGKFQIIGESVSQIQFDDRNIIDIRTGKPLENANEGSTFNLAILKLPNGSKWNFLGVARGPTRMREFMRVNGWPSREQVLVAMGLNMTSKGNLVAVTQGQTLDFPMIPRKGCEAAGAWIATYGAEDPRLFWTDAGTPGLTYGSAALDNDRCRSVGFVHDMRSIFPELNNALRTGVEGVRPYNGHRDPGEGNDKELIRLEKQGTVEKNWMPFYPGALPDGESLVPHIHYMVKSALSLEPIKTTPSRVIYKDVDLSNSNSKSCIGNAHSKSFKIHQATPLYRLTLCERGCIVTKQNTINIALSHTQSPSRQYGRFLATFNVSYPFNPISVGPRFHLNGCDDENDINYALTLAPIQQSDLGSTVKPTKTPQIVQPDHFFLDDHMLITMGHNDNEMTTVLATVEEILGRQHMC
ncbi:uncharacterized protein I206_107862 [Kwoniella pini CBS 10737]|uniref:Uncharacterized protein n=1 Tax=Kwoniella pini CBS 10737 TaxID=1296096 RepID=A0A1B9HYH0_9TREE|nr:uncharacterized protein I206_06193 [Kwoniella pini CBS 10737]OCF48325.1 hypothetical protein I206_06193 [Kwoniella pini CBS 10737]